MRENRSPGKYVLFSGITFCFLALVIGLILVGASFSQGTSAPKADGQLSAAPTISDPAQAGLFIFVPLPCPAPEYYQQAQAFVDQVCAAADGAHMKVIIVRSCYNDAANLLKKDWWGDEINDLPNHYKKLIEDGTVKLVDQYPDIDFDSTPCGFFYRGNKIVWKGILTEDDPATVVALITTKTIAPASTTDDTSPPVAPPAPTSH